MPRILVLGATGYIGSSLCTSLLRSSQHTVYGLARTPAKAHELTMNEIIPVIGSVSDSTAHLNLIKTAPIDIVVDCAGANMESAKLLQELVEVGRERLRQGGPKLGFVYTSGTWVHGSSLERVSDLDPVGEGARTQPPGLVAWRPALERDVLAARDVLDTVVVRPALVYGREHKVFDPLFSQILEAKASGAETVRIPLTAECQSALVHVDDAAEGLRCAANKLPLISGTGVYPVFDLATSVEAMDLVFRSAAEVWGFEGKVELVGAVEGDVFTEAMQTSGNLDCSRAEQILGWQPMRRGFVARMDIYAKAFIAAKKTGG